jgi:signal transduction histidine kinase
VPALARLAGLVRRPGWAHAARVAAVAAAVVGAVYVAVAVSFDTVDSSHLVAEVDADLRDTLQDFQLGHSHFAAKYPVHADKDVDRAPVLVWLAGQDRASEALSVSAPVLPPGAWLTTGRPTTAKLGGQEFRLMAAKSAAGWVVAGESLADTERVGAVLDRAEVVAGPVLVVAVFFAALAIGVMASRPVEQARRRQLDFTADASHELRTPLSVIEAEVGLTLSQPRESSAYREALERIATEGKRLRHIVEELLFLARFDLAPPAPGYGASPGEVSASDGPVDLAALAESCASRFAPVASAGGVALSVESDGALALVKAPAAWLDRLCGVLLDNACRYAGRGGWVRVTVVTRSGSVSLAVEDSGPGIPLSMRPRLFDRFYRGDPSHQPADGQPGGAGLGLSIADAVVRSTGGTWRVGEAPGGGAHMEVSWKRAGPFR